MGSARDVPAPHDVTPYRPARAREGEGDDSGGRAASAATVQLKLRHRERKRGGGPGRHGLHLHDVTPAFSPVTDPDEVTHSAP